MCTSFKPLAAQAAACDHGTVVGWGRQKYWLVARRIKNARPLLFIERTHLFHTPASPTGCPLAGTGLAVPRVTTSSGSTVLPKTSLYNSADPV